MTVDREPLDLKAIEAQLKSWPYGTSDISDLKSAGNRLLAALRETREAVTKVCDAYGDKGWATTKFVIALRAVLTKVRDE